MKGCDEDDVTNVKVLGRVCRVMFPPWRLDGGFRALSRASAAVYGSRITDCSTRFLTTLADTNSLS
jgi:hypothetical protein